jgi:adenylosuccinate synthase
MKAHDIELARRLIRSGQITDPSLTKLTELMDLAELNDTTKVKIKGQVGSMFEEARALAAKRSQG